MKKIIFMCNGNSARSQMAEGFLKSLAGERYQVYSAGSVAKGVNPMTVQVMKEVGIDISDQYSKTAMEYYGKIEFDIAIIVCRKAEDDCPKIAGTTRTVQRWIIDDPLSAQGTDEEKLAKFRDVRDQIQFRLKLWLAEDMEADFAR